MDAPQVLRSAADEQEDIRITHRNYGDESVVVIDFGPGVDASLDVVDDTAIVVAGDRQFEFEMPPEAAEMTTNDGLLLIKERESTTSQ
jgi:predicted ATP-binding protein involved in virulence